LIQRGTKRKVSAILTDYNQGVFDNYEDLQENGLDHDQSFANGEYNFPDADYYDNGLPDTDEPADQYQHHGGSAGIEFGQHLRMKTSMMTLGTLVCSTHQHGMNILIHIQN